RTPGGSAPARTSAAPSRNRRAFARDPDADAGRGSAPCGECAGARRRGTAGSDPAADALRLGGDEGGGVPGVGRAFADRVAGQDPPYVPPNVMLIPSITPLPGPGSK